MRLLLLEDGRTDARMALLFLIKDAPGEFSVRHVTSLADALAALAEERFELVITDLNLPDSEGADTVAALATADARLPVVVLSGVPDAGTAIAAFRAGAREVLLKSQLQTGVLAAAVRRIRHDVQQDAALDAARARITELLGLQAALLDALPTPSLLVGIDGLVRHLNPPARALLLPDAGAVPGTLRIQDLLAPDSALSPLIPELVASADASPRVLTLPVRGDGRALVWRLTPLRAPGNGTAPVVLAQIDLPVSA